MGIIRMIRIIILEGLLWNLRSMPPSWSLGRCGCHWDREPLSIAVLPPHPKYKVDVAQNVRENACLLTLLIRIAGYANLNEALGISIWDHCSNWSTGIPVAQIAIPVSSAELVSRDGQPNELSTNLWWLAADIQGPQSITITFSLRLAPSRSG